MEAPERFKQKRDSGEITAEEAARSMEGWIAYAKFANTYKFREKVAARFDNLLKES